MLPRILCLHGQGTNAAIFKIQARKLVALLEQDFELVFAEGMIDCPAGPGILPVFEKSGPFRMWLYDNWIDSEPDEEPDWSSGVQRLADDVLVKQGPFVGVLGFSQGAKAAMHLLRWAEKKYGEDSPLKFSLLVCGTVPGRGVRDPDDRRCKVCEESLALGRVKAESIHVIGSDDHWRPESEALLKFFEPETRNLVRFPGGHHMPLEDRVNTTLAQLVQAAYEGM
ncbi:serine hydrolase FSH [Apodospora peruviana]|uniref:Serine hydrolase FSH n=1 Tax=Apodospora peruviana TaxID=516989 RepID=A0AAE0ICM0_9PEZI|nr:serine hydrolase FSH [Apodospora peruviana]